jgi:hypothetical protein
MGDTPLSHVSPHQHSISTLWPRLPPLRGLSILPTHTSSHPIRRHASIHAHTHARCLTRQKAADHAARTSQDTAKGPSFSVKPPYHWPPSISVSVSLSARSPPVTHQVQARSVVTWSHAHMRAHAKVTCVTCLPRERGLAVGGAADDPGRLMKRWHKVKGIVNLC